MDILTFLREQNVPHKQAGEHEHVRAGFVGVDCPLCSPSWGHYRLGLSLSSWGASCWNCGRTPRLQALHLITGLPYHRLRELLDDGGRYQRREERPRGVLKIPKGVGSLRDAHKRYLESRGLDWKDIVHTWGVEGIGLAARLSWRLFIPITDRFGDVMSWTTRAISDEVHTRYVSARPDEEAVPLKSLLYGQWLASHSVVVVEGPTDCWRIGPGAVATLGVAWTPAQLNLLLAHPVRTICFDSEPGATRAADKLLRNLACFGGVTHRVVLDAPDPGDAGDAEVRELRGRFLA